MACDRNRTVGWLTMGCGQSASRSHRKLPGFHMRLMDASGDSSLRQDVWGRHRLEVGWEGSQERDLVRFEAAVRQVGAQSFGNWRA